MRKLAINIECSKENCATEPGKFCKFFGTMRFGTEAICMLFPSENNKVSKSGSHTELKMGDDGWTKRCKACLDHEEWITDVPKDFKSYQNIVTVPNEHFQESQSQMSYRD